MTAKLIIWGFTILGILPGLLLAVASLSIMPWRWPGRTPVLGETEFKDHLILVGGTKFGFILSDPPLWAAVLIVVGAVCIVVGVAVMLHIPYAASEIPFGSSDG